MTARPIWCRSARITRRQADYEIYAYTVFLGTLFADRRLAALACGRSDPLALYGFSVVCGTILFGATKHLWAALYCSAVPAALLCIFLFHGFPPHLARSTTSC